MAITIATGIRGSGFSWERKTVGVAPKVNTNKTRSVHSLFGKHGLPGKQRQSSEFRDGLWFSKGASPRKGKLGGKRTFWSVSVFQKAFVQLGRGLVGEDAALLGVPRRLCHPGR